MKLFASLFAAAALALTPAVVSAQTIHGHPQKAAYASPAEWPVISSQCHWTPSGAPVGLGSMLSSHIHVDPQFPIYSENTGEKITGEVTIKAFMFDGQLSGAINGELIDSYIWEDTGTSTPPDLHGDPLGLKVWKVRVTIDPLKPGAVWQFGPHGWQWARIMVRAYFTDGAHIDANQWLVFWSNIDPSQPPRLVRGGAGPILETECDVFSATNKPQFGNNLTEYDDYIPLAPIDKPWTVPVSYYSYQADPMEPFAIDQIHDMDFHHGVLGVNSAHVVLPNAGTNSTSMFFPTTFDPAQLGTGSHLVMDGWTQPNTPTGEQMSALSVITVTVGVAPPPPPPPPPPPTTLSCFGQIVATSTDGGATFTIPASTLSCGADGLFKISGTLPGIKQ